MTPAHREAIEEAIASLDAQGPPWTNKAIYARVGGSYGQLSQYLKARRAAQARVAIADGPEEDTPGAVQAVESEPAAVAVQAVAEEVPVPQSPVPSCPRLAVLQEAVHEAEALLVRLTRARDEQQATFQRAVLALYQAKREGQRLVRELRQAWQRAQATPPDLAASAWATVHQVQAQLAALIGAQEAAAVVADAHYSPAVLRER